MQTRDEVMACLQLCLSVCLLANQSVRSILDISVTWLPVVSTLQIF